MNVMEYIVEERKRQELSSEALAAKLPFTRQRMEEIIKNGDGRFGQVRLILNALGKKVDVRTTDGGKPQFDTEEFMQKIETTGVFFNRERDIIGSAGLAFVIVDGEASDGAPEEKEILL